jgi:hypothetical protein
MSLPASEVGESPTAAQKHSGCGSVHYNPITVKFRLLVM